VLVVEAPPSDGVFAQAAHWINERAAVNRAMAYCAGHAPMTDLRVRPATITGSRLDRLRQADAVVRRLSADSGFESRVWQFPVVLIPAGTADRPDSVVLRPIHSVDGMTASAVAMPEDQLREICAGILAIPGICAVFYDLTHKPPGTIEWE
jgi:GMP synthase (glutamine-hydrolysing)